MLVQTASTVNKIPISLRRSCFANDFLGFRGLGVGEGKNMDPSEANTSYNFFNHLLGSGHRAEPMDTAVSSTELCAPPRCTPGSFKGKQSSGPQLPRLRSWGPGF